jgi:hypothetical protein
MRCDGAHLLSDLTVFVLTIACERCVRRREYNVERLVLQYGGDAKLPVLLATLTADCPNRASIGDYEKCRAVYERA